MESSDKLQADPVPGVPAELEDALARIEEAKDKLRTPSGPTGNVPV